MFERSLEEQHIRSKIFKFYSVQGMRACLKRGIGYTICPYISVEKELKSKNLLQLKFSGGDEEAALIMIWHSEKWCSPLLKHFMILAEGVVSGLPYKYY